MNILLVGAGAVGKVYGRHLALGGARVSFLVKEKYATAASTGFNFYVLNESKNKDAAQSFQNFSIFTDAQSLKKQKWDYVVLCMASNSLKGEWLDELLNAIGAANVVSLQPGLNDHDYLLTKIPAVRLIDGTIPIISYESPLAGESRNIPGTAYWIPPGGTAAFSGEALPRDALVEVFNRGGLKSKSVRNARKENLIAAPVLTLFIAALEKENWSLEKLFSGDLVRKACLAMPEAVAANALKAGVAKPATWMLKPLLFKSILSASKFLVPFDLETYLKVHFTKVGEQMRESLLAYEDFAKKENLSSQKLEAFRSACLI